MLGIFRKIEHVSPTLVSIDDDAARVEFSKVTKKWHYYVHDGERFMPKGQTPDMASAIKAVKKAMK